MFLQDEQEVIVLTVQRKQDEIFYQKTFITHVQNSISKEKRGNTLSTGGAKVNTNLKLRTEALM